MTSGVPLTEREAMARPPRHRHAVATQRARQRLVNAHREEYQVLLDEEKARLGIRSLQERQL